MVLVARLVASWAEAATRGGAPWLSRMTLAESLHSLLPPLRFFSSSKKNKFQEREWGRWRAMRLRFTLSLVVATEREMSDARTQRGSCVSRNLR